MAKKTQRKDLTQKQTIPKNIDKLEKLYSATIASLLPYALAHLAEVAEDFAGLQADIVTSTVHPGQLPQVDGEEKARLEKLAAEKLEYIRQIIADLHRSNNICAYRQIESIFRRQKSSTDRVSVETRKIL